MVSVSGTKIKMTRGDTLRLKVNILLDGEEYTPTEFDEVRFAMKHRTLNSTKTEYADPEPLVEKTIPNESLILELEPSDTKPFGFDTYDYDIEITFEDGTVDTFISGTVKLEKEVD